jgi:hypothetical protein
VGANFLHSRELAFRMHSSPFTSLLTVNSLVADPTPYIACLHSHIQPCLRSLSSVQSQLTSCGVVMMSMLMVLMVLMVTLFT